MNMLKDSPLGQSTIYVETYSPDLLYPVPRSLARDKTGICHPLPFDGIDIWNAYEISWLNPKGKPVIALAELFFSCHTTYIVESKSLKLYLNSFNQTHFESFEAVKRVIEKDLENIIGDQVRVNLYAPDQRQQTSLVDFTGICLDHLDIETNTYQLQPKFLKTESKIVEETLYSDLLKSNCLATGQPDWLSVLIRYSGPKIDHHGLLKYIISFRSHSGFAEHCVEQIFNDITIHCRPEKLTVYGRCTRRGGLDINPFRSNFEKAPANQRQVRQ